MPRSWTSTLTTMIFSTALSQRLSKLRILLQTMLLNYRKWLNPARRLCFKSLKVQTQNKALSLWRQTLSTKTTTRVKMKSDRSYTLWETRRESLLKMFLDRRKSRVKRFKTGTLLSKEPRQSQATCFLARLRTQKQMETTKKATRWAETRIIVLIILFIRC